jgi:hypothetical protein
MLAGERLKCCPGAVAASPVGSGRQTDEEKAKSKSVKVCPVTYVGYMNGRHHYYAIRCDNHGGVSLVSEDFVAYPQACSNLANTCPPQSYKLPKGLKQDHEHPTKELHTTLEARTKPLEHFAESDTRWEYAVPGNPIMVSDEICKIQLVGEEKPRKARLLLLATILPGGNVHFMGIGQEMDPGTGLPTNGRNNAYAAAKSNEHEYYCVLEHPGKLHYHVFLKDLTPP